MLLTKEVVWRIRRDVLLATGSRYTIELGIRYSELLNLVTANVLLWHEEADLEETQLLVASKQPEVIEGGKEGIVVLDCYLYYKDGGLCGNIYVCLNEDGQVLFTTYSDGGIFKGAISSAREDREEREARARLDGLILLKCPLARSDAPREIIADWFEEHGPQYIAVRIREEILTTA